MLNLKGLRANLGDLWIPDIYRRDVRTLRSRSVALEIPERENSHDILHTLLGVELKVGRLRIACPDLATARYLSVFARIGCRDVAIPYDITKIPKIADGLETAWHRFDLIARGVSVRSRNLMLKAMREEIKELGAGETMPEFKQSTRQRKA